MVFLIIVFQKARWQSLFCLQGGVPPTSGWPGGNNPNMFPPSQQYGTTMPQGGFYQYQGQTGSQSPATSHYQFQQTGQQQMYQQGQQPFQQPYQGQQFYQSYQQQQQQQQAYQQQSQQMYQQQQSYQQQQTYQQKQTYQQQQAYQQQQMYQQQQVYQQQQSYQQQQPGYQQRQQGYQQSSQQMVPLQQPPPAQQVDPAVLKKQQEKLARDAQKKKEFEEQKLKLQSVVVGAPAVNPVDALFGKPSPPSVKKQLTEEHTEQQQVKGTVYVMWSGNSQD